MACALIVFEAWLAAQSVAAAPRTAGPGADRQVIEVDLLIVGGSESGTAAAVQAARLKVPSIALVNDIDWLGGQFTAEGLCAIDEWTIYHGRRVPFARSGTFLEIMQRIEAQMQARYGTPRPDNSFCAWTTCEPQPTERLFRAWLAPYLQAAGGPVQLFEHYEPVQVESATDASPPDRPLQPTEQRDSTRQRVLFTARLQDRPPLEVRARLVIDASDFGDVIRLSGAGHACGPDLFSEYREPNAPRSYDEVHRHEMNPLTHCLVLRETDEPRIVPPPEHYDERTFYGTSLLTQNEYRQQGWPAGAMKPFARPWNDSVLPLGPYSETPTIYHHRRLVDCRHLKLPAGSECILVNWPLQDYPTYNFPAHVVAELERLEPGASRKNLVEMSPAVRQVVLNDARRHALGMLHHLQTTVAARQPADEVTFRSLRLTDEFGTTDQLPPKTYVREGLRLRAMYVLREQDLRDTDQLQSWARQMAPDSLFGFQFNIDFHPTRRIFLNDDPSGPWAHIHSPKRNWSTHTDRSCFPLRALVPREHPGILAAGKNLGVSSIVSSAVRLHGHGMLSGQASGALAAWCLQQRQSPQQAARRWDAIRQVQSWLLNSSPGVLLWPYQDLAPEGAVFVAANQLAVRGILPGEAGEQDFHASKPVARALAAEAVVRTLLASGGQPDFQYATTTAEVAYADVPATRTDFAAIESLHRWTQWKPAPRFEPDAPATWGWFQGTIQAVGFPPSTTSVPEQQPLTRAQLALALWSALAERPEVVYRKLDAAYLTPGHDADGDGVNDLDDLLPLDRDNDSLPDLLDPDDDDDGLPDRWKMR